MVSRGCLISGFAINVELPPNGAVPEWVELIPAAPVGADGRAWKNDRPDAIVAAFQQEGKPLPIDWEHATEKKAPAGEPAPAAGWIVALDARNGAVWGQIEWTPRGQEQIAAREYRFLSPAFYFDANGRITRLSSAALTNKPNFRLQLNREEIAVLAIPEELAQALGLAADASVAQALSVVAQLKTDREVALNRASAPDLSKFVPRADFDAAAQRALNAEQRLKDHEKAARDQAIEETIQAALKASKIAPASVAYYKAQCQREGGLEEFKQFYQSAPELLPDSKLPGKPDDGAPALNAEAKAVAEMFGHSAEDLKKYGEREANQWR